MRKYSRVSAQERAKLLEEFCEAIAVLKDPQEIMNFLIDLLTKQELIMLTRRLKIAKLLIEGKSYQVIGEILKVAPTTIAKINQWLEESGEGFRVVAERTRKEKPKPSTSWDYALEDWRKIKRRYPLMFWPQLVIEDIIKHMNKKQKERVRQVIRKLDHKSSLYKRINKILKT